MAQTLSIHDGQTAGLLKNVADIVHDTQSEYNRQTYLPRPGDLEFPDLSCGQNQQKDVGAQVGRS